MAKTTCPSILDVPEAAVPSSWQANTKRIPLRTVRRTLTPACWAARSAWSWQVVTGKVRIDRFRLGTASRPPGFGRYWLNLTARTSNS